MKKVLFSFFFVSNWRFFNKNSDATIGNMLMVLYDYSSQTAHWYHDFHQTQTKWLNTYFSAKLWNCATFPMHILNAHFSWKNHFHIKSYIVFPIYFFYVDFVFSCFVFLAVSTHRKNRPNKLIYLLKFKIK